MKPFKFILILSLVVVLGISLSSFMEDENPPVKRLKFPYKHAGLTKKEAAAHLLSRFTYGATPGQVDAVAKMGLENWFIQQLNADLPDDSLERRLSSYNALHYSNGQVANIFQIRGNVYNMAAKDGYISKDSINVAVDKKAFDAQIDAYMKAKGFQNEGELYRQFYDQKILRATYTNNQMQEVLTDFWFNHFNVSFSKNGPARFIPAYERDVIRPNVFGKFNQLVLATAKSPAMLYYLDNFTSVAPPPPTQQPKTTTPPPAQMMDGNNMMMGMSMNDTAHKTPAPPIPPKNVSGLNENYAREVMELHVLGVDGGYTQQDVTQAARILTGWTVYPMGIESANNGILKQYQKNGEAAMAKQGYVHDSDFLFVPTRHDKGEKIVLGKTFPAKGGYEEGVALLEMLTHYPSAAKFITKKIAIHFVCDDPPASLLDKMSKAYMDNDGDIKQVLITMVTAPEFWSATALREKTKSPYELAISSLRALNADVQQPVQIYNRIAKMGQKLYYYLAPTGFPDQGSYWINTGSLLNRMNFGLELAGQKIPGVKFNLAALNNNHEPESAEQALQVYGKLLMPERNLDQTIKQLTPLLNNPNLTTKVSNAVNNTTNPPQITMVSNTNNSQLMSNTLSQIVGIIIGSPEFQRR